MCNNWSIFIPTYQSEFTITLKKVIKELVNVSPGAKLVIKLQTP